MDRTVNVPFVVLPLTKKPASTRLDIGMYKVLKKTHPSLGISNKCMNIVECFANDIFLRIMQQSKELALRNWNGIDPLEISKHDVEHAVDLILSGSELGKYAKIEANKSVDQFLGSFVLDDENEKYESCNSGSEPMEIDDQQQSGSDQESIVIKKEP